MDQQPPPPATPPPPTPPISEPPVPPASPVTEPVENPQPAELAKASNQPMLRMVIFVLVGLLIGVIGGYFFGSVGKAAQKEPLAQGDKTQDFKLPLDAAEIQQCATGKGTLYARPQDVPLGPVYMVHDGRVVGIEYMVEREEFLRGEGMDHLTVQKVPIDHVNVGILEEGHAGFPGQHFHVDLYTIDESAEKAITCPDGSDEHMVMPGMNMTATPSASVTQAQEMKMDMSTGTPTPSMSM